MWHNPEKLEHPGQPQKKYSLIEPRFKITKELALILQTDHLFKKIKTSLEYLQKRKQLKALYSTNKAAAMAKLLTTTNFLPSTHTTTAIFRGTRGNDPLPRSDVSSDYVVSSMKTNDKTITLDILPVPAASPRELLFNKMVLNHCLQK